MNAKEMVLASLQQSRGYLDRSLDGLTQEDIAWSPNEDCNSIAFILWHTTRVEDFFITRVIQRKPELYEADGWRDRLGTPPDSGYGYSPAQLQAWPIPGLEDLRGYMGAVRNSTLGFLEELPLENILELARPDRSPDTIGGILSRVITEIALHMGQIDYIRGLRRGFLDTAAPG